MPVVSLLPIYLHMNLYYVLIFMQFQRFFVPFTARIEQGQIELNPLFLKQYSQLTLLKVFILQRLFILFSKFSTIIKKLAF